MTGPVSYTHLLADTLDLQFLWECAPQEEFDSPVLAAAYFGHAPTPAEQAALLMRLHGAPAYLDVYKRQPMMWR